MPKLARHKVGVIVHRACLETERSEINDQYFQISIYPNIQWLQCPNDSKMMNAGWRFTKVSTSTILQLRLKMLHPKSENTKERYQ